MLFSEIADSSAVVPLLPESGVVLTRKPTRADAATDDAFSLRAKLPSAPLERSGRAIT